MQIGMVGLGRMGANMVRRLTRRGHTCIVFDINPDRIKELKSEGAIGAISLIELVEKLTKPRITWLMLPAGEPTEQTILELSSLLEREDIIVDGGNSFYKDDARRAEMLKTKGIHYIDVGTSGGIFGLEQGFCLMVGGETEIVRYLDPIFKTHAPNQNDAPETTNYTDYLSTAKNGYLHCGPVGAGHFVKMVHNGIEYALMQAYAEGFDILRNACCDALPEKTRYNFNLVEIAELWRHGSIIRSHLLDLLATALAEDPNLENHIGFVQDSGEGRWTVLTAIEQAVPVPTISEALYVRFRSRKAHTFAEKILSALRHKFGGHGESNP